MTNSYVQRHVWGFLAAHLLDEEKLSGFHHDFSAYEFVRLERQYSREREFWR